VLQAEGDSQNSFNDLSGGASAVALLHHRLSLPGMLGPDASGVAWRLEPYTSRADCTPQGA